MSNTFTFRKAGINDIPLIQALAGKIWDEAYKEVLAKEQIGYMLEMMYSEKTIKEELSRNVVWEIISGNGRPFGFLSYSLEQGNAVKLSKIYIERDFRGGEAAKKAINHVIRYAQKNGRQEVYLTVNKNNRMAIRAYEKNGFSIVDSVVIDIGGGFAMDDYVMKFFVKPKR